MEYKVDAKGKKLGRLASEIATILMGKDSLDFAKNKIADVKVNVSNASGVVFSSDKKMDEKRYKEFSGYPGGLKVKSASEIIKKHGHGEVIRNAVRGMLPKNKLREKVLKNLIFSE